MKITRRELFAAAAAASTGRAYSADAPTAPVAVARCADYDAALRPALEALFTQLGGLATLVKGKTVAIKINMTGGPTQRMERVPSELAQYTHPAVVGQVVSLLDHAGARRIRILEGCFACSDPLPEFMLETGWDPAPLFSAGARVEMENTNIVGPWKRYALRQTPKGGHIFPAIAFNAAYAESDIIVSIAKMKEHATAGVTLAMKNMFGATPISIYGDHAGKDEPNEDPKGGRGVVMHYGSRPPSKNAPAEKDPSTPRMDKYRIPRIVADVTAALPIHLSIIDGIVTMAGGEGPWIRGVRPCSPGLLVAGLNPVCTDAVGTALMGFNPMADRGTAPFESCDSTLKLAEELGVGTRDLKRIEVRGVPVETAVFKFRRA
jgi:uncharacterized protein (DUF362 family)